MGILIFIVMVASVNTHVDMKAGNKSVQVS